MTSRTLIIAHKEKDDLDLLKSTIQQKLPAFQAYSVLLIDPQAKLGQVFSAAKQYRNEKPDQTVISYRLNLLLTGNYSFIFLLALAGFFKNPIFLQSDGSLLSYWAMCKETIFLPFAPIFVLLGLPGYFYRQIIRSFILTPEHPEDEFVGFGAGRKFNAIIYWLIFPNKIKKFGLFGLAHDNYWGMPLSVHSWPAANFFLNLLGFRSFSYFSHALLAGGMVWLGLVNGQSWLLILIPVILFSNYIIFNIYVGTWELLSWGWGMLAICAYQAQFPELAGVFFALCLLSHPGVSTLVALVFGTYAVVTFTPFSSFFLLIRMGVVAGLCCLWWIIPYYRSLRYMGRTNNQNLHWSKNRRWSISAVHQILSFSIFAVAATFASGKPVLALILLIPPLIVYYNVTINWIFSQYTTMNLFFMAGFIFLMNYSTPIGWILYIYILFTSVKLIWGINMDPYKGYDLTPLTLGSGRQEFVQAFDTVKGRIAFEMELSMKVGAWRFTPIISYLLASKEIDLVNIAYSQIGDPRIVEKYCQLFNARSSPEAFRNACLDCGVDYMTAVSDEFRQYLEKIGAEQISELDNQVMADSPDDPPLKITIYRLPWTARLISEGADLKVETNRMSFTALAGKTYHLKYTAFAGWRAYQNGKRLPIRDANPGIEIKAEVDGEIQLEYSLHHYWGK